MFLHSQSLPSKHPVFDKAKQKAWQRRIKRAKKPFKKKLKLALIQVKNAEIWNLMLSEVISGTAISVMEEEGMIQLDLTQIYCPICNHMGTIKLNFASNCICPKCHQGALLALCRPAITMLGHVKRFGAILARLNLNFS